MELPSGLLEHAQLSHPKAVRAFSKIAWFPSTARPVGRLYQGRVTSREVKRQAAPTCSEAARRAESVLLRPARAVSPQLRFTQAYRAMSA